MQLGLHSSETSTDNIPKVSDQTRQTAKQLAKAGSKPIVTDDSSQCLQIR